MTNQDNSRMELQADPEGGYRIGSSGFRLADAPGALIADGREYPLPWQPVETTADSVAMACSNDAGDWRLRFSRNRTFSGDSGWEISWSGTLREPLKNLRITLLRHPELECDHLLAQGQRTGGCLSRCLPVDAPMPFEGYYQLMLRFGKQHWQLAFPLRSDHSATFAGLLTGNAVQGLEARVEISNYDGLELRLPTLTFRKSENGFHLMEDWAEANREKERRTVAPGIGWNTWDYYRWTVTEEAVLQNAEFIARDPVLSRHVKRIVIDDGWQYCYGEWEANPLFPSGMAKLARELTRMGFEPGLWFAPAIVEPHARIAQLHTEMLAQGESGLPCLAFECMRRHGFVLDPTQPQVQRHLHELFRRYADMGYRYFKLDFLHAPTRARQFADRTVPQGEIVRKLLEPIHAAIRGRASIMGCNYPFLAGSDYVDAVRIGADIAANWDSVGKNALSVAARFWANRRLWVNDPDFALCRGPETSDDPELNQLKPHLVFVTPGETEAAARIAPISTATRAQLEVLLGIALMAAGEINLSDNLPRLNASGLDLARRIVSAETGETGIPLDLFLAEKPSYWLQRIRSGHRALLINWTAEKKQLGIELRQYGIRGGAASNFWTGEPLPFDGGSLTAVLNPQSCLLAEIRK